MRLSDVLSSAPDPKFNQVEPFLGTKRLQQGKNRNIKAGKIARNIFCSSCKEVRTFTSGDTLSCVAISESEASIDTVLKCPVCSNHVACWFLIRCEGDMFSQAPSVLLERRIEHQSEKKSTSSRKEEAIERLLERADIAFHNHLGAGAMIYLRKVFEIVTLASAKEAGIPVETNSRKKSFRKILQEVDEACKIIPNEFREDGYRLFKELSEVIHDESDEDQAIHKYEPCLKLIRSIVTNIKNTKEVKAAAFALGWSHVDQASFEGGKN